MTRADQIEQSLQNLRDWYAQNHKASKVKMKERVHKLLLEHPEKIWWFAWQVNGSTTKDGYFISHRGCARLTDLVDDGICESAVVGKYTVYRLK